jgi:hypothetical protein
MVRLAQLLAVATLWIVTLVRARGVVQARRRHRTAHFLKAWLFILFLTLFVTVEFEALYSAIGAYSGANNLAWLLAYVFGGLCTYFLCAAFYGEKMPRWTLPLLIISLLLLTLFFPFGPGSTPDTTHHDIPGNLVELLFLASHYVYGIVMMSTFLVRVSARAYLKERDAAIRLRSLVIFLLASSWVAFYVTKLATFSLAFVAPSSPLVLGVSQILGTWFLIELPLFTLGFLPNRFYRVLLEPVGFFTKVLAARDLHKIRTQTDRLCPLMPPLTTRMERLRNPDLDIYHSLIAILDAKRLLTGWQVEEEHKGDEIGPGPETAVNPVHAFWEDWSKQDREKAAHFCHLFQSVPDSLEFDDMVAAYRNLSRQMQDTKGGEHLCPSQPS